MLILDDEELKKLPGKSQRASQCKALRLMGVRFGERLDGWPIVTKEAVLEYTDLSVDKDKPEVATLNWG